MSNLISNIISLFKLSFQKTKIIIYSIFSGIYFCSLLKFEIKEGNMSFELIQPDMGSGETIAMVFILIVLIIFDFILITIRGRRSLDVIKDPNVPDDIKKIFAEDYKNTR